MKLSDWIVQALIDKGVTHVFTLQGGFSMHLNDSIGHSALTPVYMLHESGAAFAAAGWAQYTGQVGVCVITSGLAQTNALSGVASAFSDYLPMLIISGDIKREDMSRRDENGLRQGGQQDVPIAKIAKPVTKFITTARSAEYARFYFSVAWTEAITTPKGPAWLNIPLDVQAEDVT